MICPHGTKASYFQRILQLWKISFGNLTTQKIPGMGFVHLVLCSVCQVALETFWQWRTNPSAHSDNRNSFSQWKGNHRVKNRKIFLHKAPCDHLNFLSCRSVWQSGEIVEHIMIPADWVMSCGGKDDLVIAKRTCHLCLLPGSPSSHSYFLFSPSSCLCILSLCSAGRCLSFGFLFAQQRAL